MDPPDSRVTVSVPEKHDLSKKDVDRFFEDWRGIMLGYRVESVVVDRDGEGDGEGEGYFRKEGRELG